MKRLIGFMLAMIMLASGSGLAETMPAEVFALRDGVSWNSSQADVLAAFPEASVRAYDDVPLIGSMALIGVEDVPVSTTQADMALIFFDGQLSMIVYSFYAVGDNTVPVEQMRENLVMKYGSTEAADTVPFNEETAGLMGEDAAEAMIGDVKDFSVWMADESTRITLFEHQYADREIDGMLYMTILYEYLPVWDVLGEAVAERAQRIFGL